MYPPVPYDPTILPRPCTAAKCKNHVPGNSSFKRCPIHMRAKRTFSSSYAAKRERQKEVYRNALEEGRNPEEALKEYLVTKGEQKCESSDEDAEGEDDETVPAKRKPSKKVKVSHNIDPSLLPSALTKDPNPVQPVELPTRLTRRNDMEIPICSGKECMNLLLPDVGLYFPLEAAHSLVLLFLLSTFLSCVRTVGNAKKRANFKKRLRQTVGRRKPCEP